MNTRLNVRCCGHRPAECLLALALCMALAAPLALGKAVTLQWATWGPPQIDRELIAAFEKANPDIRIEYIGSSYGEHHQKVKVLAAAGQPPDVFAVDGFYTAEFATTRLVRPIDDLIARDGRFQNRDYFSAALLDVQYQGKTYGLPYISAPQYLLYNVTHMAEAGLPPPNMHWNRETFIEYARKLTQSDGTRTTRWGSSQHVNWGTFWPWLWAGGGRAFDEAHKRFLLTEPAALEALQWSADLRTVRNVAGSGDFVRQTVSMAQLYPGGFPSVTGMDWPFEWDVAIPPAGEGGQYGIWKGNVMGISPATPHVAEAWTFLKFLLAPDSPGHEIYVRNKRFPPQTPDRRLWNVFQKPGAQPKSLLDVTILLATKHGRTLPHLLQWDAIVAKAIGPALLRIQAGEVSARVAMEETRPVVERLLAAEP